MVVHRSASMLNILDEKLVQPAINSNHVSCCPTMDLIALATVDEKVHVYRLNGQRVFGVVSKPSVARVNQIRWKPNGKNHFCPDRDVKGLH